MTKLKRAERKALIDSVEWLAADSGYGHGICSFAHSMMWSMDRPTKEKPDYKSTVFLKGPDKEYTDEELILATEFAHRHTARYDRLFGIRRGCNAILFGKEVERYASWQARREVSHTRWLCKRMSWEYGIYHMPTLPQAIARFNTDVRAEDLIGFWTKLQATNTSPGGYSWTGDEAVIEVVGTHSDWKHPESHELLGRTEDGQEIRFHRARMGIVGKDRESYLRLVELDREQLAYREQEQAANKTAHEAVA